VANGVHGTRAWDVACAQQLQRARVPAVSALHYGDLLPGVSRERAASDEPRIS
jgi:hypothetical protein